MNSMNGVKQFQKFLEERAAKWSDAPAAELGFRIVRIDGEIMRYMLMGDVELHWRELERQLPHDAVVMDTDGRLMLQALSCGAYTDAHLIIFGSREWEKIDESQPIPELRPVMETRPQSLEDPVPIHAIVPHDDQTS